MGGWAEVAAMFCIGKTAGADTATLMAPCPQEIAFSSNRTFTVRTMSNGMKIMIRPWLMRLFHSQASYTLFIKELRGRSCLSFDQSYPPT